MSWLETHPHEVRFCGPYNNGIGFKNLYKFLGEKFGHLKLPDRWIVSASSVGSMFEGTVRFKYIEDAIVFKLSIDCLEPL